MSTCARCKTAEALIGSRCMACWVRTHVRRHKLDEELWWRRAQPAFCALMVGRYLNDGLGDPPPSKEEVVRSMKIWYAANRSHHLDNIYAMIDEIDHRRVHDVRS